MSHQLYGSPSYGRSVAGGLHQVPSSSFAPCPPGLVRPMGDGFHSPSLSFVPPPANISQCAHPCSPSVHDCAFVGGGMMNTYEVADPYATVWQCHDDRSAS
eukprot:4646689-Amphidinium_carterae.1